MADPSIDQYETLIYGKFAREQMAAMCLGKIKELDKMVEFAISIQETADSDMQAMLERHPRPAPAVDPGTALEAASDVVVRFGSYLDSLKGRPFDPRMFFRGDVPSVLARRRLTKLTAAIGHIVSEIGKAKDQIRDKSWLEEFEQVHAQLQAVEKRQRSVKVDRVELAPEVAAARSAWLNTYNANKLLIRGLLTHVGKPELLPLIFDDLPQGYQASSTSDDGDRSTS